MKVRFTANVTIEEIVDGDILITDKNKYAKDLGKVIDTNLPEWMTVKVEPLEYIFIKD